MRRIQSVFIGCARSGRDPYQGWPKLKFYFAKSEKTKRNFIPIFLLIFAKKNLKKTKNEFRLSLIRIRCHQESVDRENVRVRKLSLPLSLSTHNQTASGNF